MFTSFLRQNHCERDYYACFQHKMVDWKPLGRKSFQWQFLNLTLLVTVLQLEHAFSVPPAAEPPLVELERL